MNWRRRSNHSLHRREVGGGGRLAHDHWLVQNPIHHRGELGGVCDIGENSGSVSVLSCTGAEICCAAAIAAYAAASIWSAEFRKRCREYATEQIDLQRRDFKRLGVLGDWENPYRTMDFRFEADMVRALAKIVERGHLARGAKAGALVLRLRLVAG